MSSPESKSAAQVGDEYRAQVFAQCANGVHDPQTKYGTCGVVAAIILFPFGLIWMCLDKEKRCARCGVRL